MKSSEFKRELERLGASFKKGKGSHFKVTLNGVTTVFPFHGSKELNKITEKAIRKQLKID